MHEHISENKEQVGFFFFDITKYIKTWLSVYNIIMYDAGMHTMILNIQNKRISNTRDPEYVITYHLNFSYL